MIKSKTVLGKDRKKPQKNRLKYQKKREAHKWSDTGTKKKKKKRMRKGKMELKNKKRTKNNCCQMMNFH